MYFYFFIVYKQVDWTRTDATWGTWFFTPGLLEFLGCVSLGGKCMINRGYKEWHVHVPTSRVSGPLWFPLACLLRWTSYAPVTRTPGLSLFPFTCCSVVTSSHPSKLSQGYLTSEPAFLISPGWVKCSLSEFSYYLDFFLSSYLSYHFVIVIFNLEYTPEDRKFVCKMTLSWLRLPNKYFF